MLIHFASLIEGYLDEYLVKEILKGVASGINPALTFNRHKKLVPFKGGSKNKTKVLAAIKNLSQQIALEATTSDSPILFVTGIDSDGEGFDLLVNQLWNEVHARAKNTTLIFVAVRDVETWAEYFLKPDSVTGSLDRGSSKDKIYPDGKSNEANAKAIIKELREKSCFSNESMKHLCTQSPSFHHFHQQIEDYINRIS